MIGRLWTRLSIVILMLVWPLCLLLMETIDFLHRLFGCEGFRNFCAFYRTAWKEFKAGRFM